MKNLRPLGLLIEGNATSSVVLRLPSIPNDLGPIKAGAQRVARRLSNFLQAGYPVTTYAELKAARLIFVRAPDASLARIVDEISSEALPFKQMSFVLCESCLTSDSLAGLQALGASVASLMQVPTMRKSWFITEGSPSAIRQIRAFLQQNDARAFDLHSGGKSLYFAAQVFASVLPTALLASAQLALRRAGISGNYLHSLLEEMLLEMFRTFSNGARFNQQWAARLGCSEDTAASYLAQLSRELPEMAALLDRQLALAAETAAPPAASGAAK